MAEQAQQKAQKDSSPSGAEIAAIVAILAAGPPLVTAVGAISAALKMPKKFVLGIMSIVKYKPGKKAGSSGADPLTDARKRNLRFRAAYLINAIKRLADAPDLKTGLTRERQLFAAHVQASKRRMDAAKASVKMADDTHSTVIGWGGILDDRTTADCRWLIGKNYAVGNPPEGLHPGGRHSRCRCYPQPAWPGKPVVTALPLHLAGNSPL